MTQQTCGLECAGAVVISEEGTHPPVGSLRPLTPADLAERLTALPAHPYDDNDAIRISLGGFQTKMLTDEAQAWAIGRRISGGVVEDALQRLGSGAQIASERFPTTDPTIIGFVQGRIRCLLDTLRQER